MVDLLVLACLDQLLFILKILFTFFTKQPTLKRRSPKQIVTPIISIPLLNAKFKITAVNCTLKSFTAVIGRIVIT
jgi:hypothetical protein